MAYVKWKLLISCAAVMWGALLFVDWYAEDLVDNNYSVFKTTQIEESEEIGDIPQVEKQLNFNKDFVDKENKSQLVSSASIESHLSDIDNEGKSWFDHFWNVFAFVTSVASCIIIREFLNSLTKQFYISRRNKSKREEVVITVPPQLAQLLPQSSCQQSRIPKLKIKRSYNSLTDLKPSAAFTFPSDDSTSASDNQTGVTLTRSRHRKMREAERTCVQLKREIVQMKENAASERNVLQRKLETSAAQKRELSKQLACALKENRAAKIHLNDLLEERTVLLKKIDNISKEFQTSTKNKINAMKQLEDLQKENMDLKKQICVVQQEKSECEKRIVSIEKELLQMKMNVNKYTIQLPMKIESGKEEKMTELKPDKDESNQNIKIYSPGSSLVEHVQRKLENLERNIEQWQRKRAAKLLSEDQVVPNNASPLDDFENISELYRNCYTSLCSTTETNKEVNMVSSRLTSQDKDQPSEVGHKHSDCSICMESDCPLDHETCTNVECLKKSREDISNLNDKLNNEVKEISVPTIFNPEDMFQKYCTQAQIAMLENYVKENDDMENEMEAIASLLGRNDTDTSAFSSSQPMTENESEYTENGSSTSSLATVPDRSVSASGNLSSCTTSSPPLRPTNSTGAIIMDSPAFKQFLKKQMHHTNDKENLVF